MWHTLATKYKKKEKKTSYHYSSLRNTQLRPRGVEEGLTDICSNVYCCSHWTLKGKYYHYLVGMVSKHGCTTSTPIVHHHMSKTMVN